MIGNFWRLVCVLPRLNLRLKLRLQQCRPFQFFLFKKFRCRHCICDVLFLLNKLLYHLVCKLILSVIIIQLLHCKTIAAGLSQLDKIDQFRCYFLNVPHSLGLSFYLDFNLLLGLNQVLQIIFGFIKLICQNVNLGLLLF